MPTWERVMTGMFAPVLLLAVIATNGCQRCQCSLEQEKNKVHTRVVDPSGKILDNVRASYRPPGGTGYADFELLQNQHGHWGWIPGKPSPEGTVRFSRPKYLEATYAKRDVPNVVQLTPEESD